MHKCPLDEQHQLQPQEQTLEQQSTALVEQKRAAEEQLDHKKVLGQRGGFEGVQRRGSERWLVDGIAEAAIQQEC